MRTSMSFGLGRSTVAIAAVVAGLAVIGLRAQSDGQPQFRSGVEVVLLDVSVVDQAARSVDGLGPSDFSVVVDSRPRRIVSAQYIEYGVKGARLDSSPRHTTPTPAAPPVGRDVLLVVDEDSMDVPTGLEAVRAAGQFLDRLGPNDRTGVVTIPRSSTRLELTTRRSDTKRELSRIVAGGASTAPSEFAIGLAEAFAIEGGDAELLQGVIDRECGRARSDSGCSKRVLADVQQIARQAHQRAEASLVALRQLAEALRQLDGPKTMVLVSGGMPVPDSSSHFSRVESALASAQVSLYTLYVEHSQFGNARSRPTPTAASDDWLESDGIENVTAAAGGALVRVAGQIEAGFDRVATEMAGSYLLGIEVSATDRDGRTHSVRVTSNRPGLVVRARRQYVIAPATAAERRAAGTIVAGPVPPEPKTAARAPRTAPVRAVEVTPPEVEAVIARAGAYATGYETAFSGLVCEEDYVQTYSRYKRNQLSGPGAWSVEATRDSKADYLLVKAPSVAGWIPFRDVFEVDGRPVREREERLKRLFLEQPTTAIERAREVMAASARYNIGFIERNVNLPTLALMFLHPANRMRFNFRKLGEQTIAGVPTWQIAYAERQSPTLVRGDGEDDNPAEGTFWIDPEHGRVVRSRLRLNPDPSSVEITVTYRPNEKLGDLWVPVEMLEIYNGPEVKVVAEARYSNFRRFQVITDQVVR